jgi:hypothetical protein
VSVVGVLSFESGSRDVMLRMEKHGVFISFQVYGPNLVSQLELDAVVRR